jgi:N-acetylglutamate synthase-like GNAT family acetyltransferase
MGHRDIIIRGVKNEDGPAVAALMKKADYFQWENFEIDWSDLEPHWLVADNKGQIVGCIQVTPARPIGRIEMLCVDPDLKLLTRGYVVKHLTDHAVGVNVMYGAQAVASSIPYELQGYFEEASSRGWTETNQGYIIMKRLM